MLHAHVDELFPGMKVKGCYQFRVTRNSDLCVDEEEVENLRTRCKGELLAAATSATRCGWRSPTNCPTTMIEFLLRAVRARPSDDLYRVDGPVNLNRLIAVYDLVDRPDLKYPPFTPGLPRRSRDGDDIFEAMRAAATCCCTIRSSRFAPVRRVRPRRRPHDPNVLAIKQTLYRTGTDSPLVDALIDAARAGKEVTVVVELRARFDEEANIELGDAPAGGRRARGLRRGRPQDAREDAADRAARGRTRCAATCTSAPATTTRHRARLHRLRPAHRRPRRSARTCTRSSCSSPGLGTRDAS